MDRRILQLEMERVSVGNDSDSLSMQRLEGIDRELATLKADQAIRTAEWRKNREAVDYLQALKQKIEDTQGEIADKQQGIKDTMESIQTADTEFNELKDERAKAKQEFETEHADYVDAIQALNQAIDILADFYRDSALIQQPALSLIQIKQPVVPDAAARADMPDMQTLSGGYVKKGGGAVVQILKTTRQDFQTGQHNLELEEAQQVKDFEAAKDAYTKSRADLVDAGNRFQAELQGAQLSLAQAETDLADNKDKVQAATTYLGQVGGSCNVLIQNFESHIGRAHV